MCTCSLHYFPHRTFVVHEKYRLTRMSDELLSSAAVISQSQGLSTTILNCYFFFHASFGRLVCHWCLSISRSARKRQLRIHTSIRKVSPVSPAAEWKHYCGITLIENTSYGYIACLVYHSKFIVIQDSHLNLTSPLCIQFECVGFYRIKNKDVQEFSFENSNQKEKELLDCWFFAHYDNGESSWNTEILW